jgi:hypothetical protein
MAPLLAAGVFAQPLVYEHEREEEAKKMKVRDHIDRLDSAQLDNQKNRNKQEQ